MRFSESLSIELDSIRTKISNSPYFIQPSEWLLGCRLKFEVKLDYLRLEAIRLSQSSEYDNRLAIDREPSTVSKVRIFLSRCMKVDLFSLKSVKLIARNLHLFTLPGEEGGQSVQD